MGNTSTKGEEAYSIKQKKAKKLGEGLYGVVYQIKHKATK